MPITDIAGNSLAPGSTGQMLGYVEPPEGSEVLSLQIYDFLIRPIREADVIDGGLFVQRFLAGPQEVWRRIQESIFRVKDLWDINRIEDRFLPYLKNIVGWTPELESPITNRLDSVTLRRLIALSAQLWKLRGTEDAYLALLAIVTTERTRIWNWFDQRWILDETAIGQDHQGRDIFMLASPGVGFDEYHSNLRIVDPDGDTLDRALVRNLVRLFRPSGERVTINYIDFLDQFLVDGDNTQWSSPTTDPILVNDRALRLSNDLITETAIATVEYASDWQNYVAYWRIQGSGENTWFGVLFYWTDEDNWYSFELSWPLGLRLRACKAGVTTTLASLVWVVGAFHYGVRIHVQEVLLGTQIRVYLDSEEIITYLDAAAPLTQGTIGVTHTSNSTLILSDCELFQLPAESDFIDINTRFEV